MRETGRQIIRELVTSYSNNFQEFKRPNYVEARLRIDFIDKFLEALGWDISNVAGKPQKLRDVIVENVIGGRDEDPHQVKRPDYALCHNGDVKLFIEAKKSSLDILTDRNSALQIRRYGWMKRLPLSILTNFENLIFYDCTFTPFETENPGYAVWKTFHYTEYVERFDEIYDIFSFDAINSGRFDQITPEIGQSAEKIPFDEYFLDQIEKWRQMLGNELIISNSRLTQPEINYLIQRLINRIIFLRICEDRHLECYEALRRITNYSELKELFLSADRKYNSGLFDFIDDALSLDIAINDAVLINVFRELYSPYPYKFSVVEANILGEIYERFLGKEIRIVDRTTIEIFEKPEVVESKGVVPTPKFIVDAIIERTLKPKCEGKTPDEISTIRIIDCSCGSGTFLVAALDYLFYYHLEWYLREGVEQYADKIYKENDTTFYLTIQEKCRILLNNIYGIDIDHQAVEVTRFSLLLKTLENDKSALIEVVAERTGNGVLPKLDNNIVCGNSLVDSSYFNFDPESRLRQDTFSKINPFDWGDKFHDIIVNSGGFDVIIGNPPYIRSQNMVKYSQEEVEFYKSRYSPFTTVSGNFDKYYLFIERGLSFLRDGGSLGFIVPHKFFKLVSGIDLRRKISSNKHLSEIVTFGVEQVFPGKDTYTCILILSAGGNQTFTVDFVTNISDWKYAHNTHVVEYQSDYISEKPWIFIHPRFQTLYDRIIQENNTKLSDVADVLVGPQTSGDKIFIVIPIEKTDSTIRFRDKIDGSIREIEKAILRPCIYDSENVIQFGKIHSNSFMIFPYKINQNMAVPYTQEEMSTTFPLCWSYLSVHQALLISRSIHLPRGQSKNDWWHLFGRPQNMTKFEGGREKIIWTTLSLEPRYAIDDNNTIYTGGGNGPYYGLEMKGGIRESIYYIQAILGHPIIDEIVKLKGSQFRGNYISHGKQFVKELPIKRIDFNNPSEVATHDSIVLQVKTVIELNEKIERTNTPHIRDNLIRQKEMIINSVILPNLNLLYGFDVNDLRLVAPE